MIGPDKLVSILAFPHLKLLKLKFSFQFESCFCFVFQWKAFSTGNVQVHNIVQHQIKDDSRFPAQVDGLFIVKLNCICEATFQE